MSKSILVIDDESASLEMFELLLSAYGYDVVTADSGEQGIELFREKNPTLVLTDIKMPGLDGMQVLKRIKELNHRAEVIVVTGHGDMDLAIEALNLDATDFINKPVQRHALDQALRRAEERMRLARDKEHEVALRQDEKATVIAIQGNITSNSEPFLQDAYRKAQEERSRKIILHFDQNASINGAGIAVLTQLLLDARGKGLDVAVAGLSENFRKVFEIVGITKLVEVFDTEEEALASGPGKGA